MNHLSRWLSLILFAGLALEAMSQPSALNARQFDKYWMVEAEAPDSRVTFIGSDTCEILAPKGLTLWRKEKLHGDITIEYDACVMDEGQPGDRLSDLNCFWMASDPHAPSALTRASWRGGVFLRSYSLQLYYMGYGGNHNTTTRFRRYTGDEGGIDDATRRPAILREYTDTAHLLRPNHWYHIRLRNSGNRVQYFIDGELLVDYTDPNPLREGWFGFRTTLSRTRITHFRSYPTPAIDVPLSWTGPVPSFDQSVSFGVPFAKGELKSTEGLTVNDLATDAWVNARWDDGSVKWAGLATVVPAGTQALVVRKQAKGKGEAATNRLRVDRLDRQYIIDTGKTRIHLPLSGKHLIDSIILGNTRVAGSAWLTATVQDRPSNSDLSPTLTHHTSHIDKVTVERQGNFRAVVRADGTMSDGHHHWLPFTVRLYFFAGSEQVRVVHSFTFDGDQQHDFIKALGLTFTVPLREEAYNRHIAFATGDGVWSEPVQPLDGRTAIGGRDEHLQVAQMRGERIANYDTFGERDRALLDNWAKWDAFRLSQLDDQSFTIRKKTQTDAPWIGTYTGHRASGLAFVGDVSGGLCIGMEDFWQSYPSTIEVEGARSSEAHVTMWLWSPEAEAMDLRHYDTVAHGLMASYEDVQDSMSTPYGIARTTAMTLLPMSAYPGKAAIYGRGTQLSEGSFMTCLPSYLHDKRAFGVWSLPDSTTTMGRDVERRLDDYITFYQHAIEQHHWYGFWNYGDMMHAYDPERHEWRYDVGGFAWDNTELATPVWLWHAAIRSGRHDIWRMAVAMTRHNCEVDTYHAGPWAGLGTRHNVSHWGCGAKEARISQAAFSRYLYYLTTDERIGDIMDEVRDGDQLLYTLDPMRLAEPREKYPTSAPARLRIGPDWIAYAGNWMTAWERHGDTRYRDKIITGMKSIAHLPHGIFTGHLALGYDPATGVITFEGDTTRQITTHLLSIMGGFEIMNEMLAMTDVPEFRQTWLDYATKVGFHPGNTSRFRYVKRLMAYAASEWKDDMLADTIWKALWSEAVPPGAPYYHVTTVSAPEVPAPREEWRNISTNQAALWSLDAIYMQEVIPR